MKTENKRKCGVFTKIWAVIYLICSAGFIGELIHVNVLPMKYLWIVIAVIAILFLIVSPALFSVHFKKSRKIICFILSVVIIIAYGAAFMYMNGTLDFISKITKANVHTEEYYVLVKEDSAYKDIDEIKGKTVQSYLTNEAGYSEAKGILREEEDVEYEMSESLSGLAEGLLNEDFEIGFVSAVHFKTICEKKTGFDKACRILYTVKVEVEPQDISKDVDVTEDSFNIYISGLDVKGKIDVTSRSDVNMILTVNPKTHTLLLTSIPRDYCIKLPSKDNASDKLTHTGIYGINETVKSVENLMGIDINYYVKVNYSTVMKLVDSIGGIDVKSDYTFTTSGMHIAGLNGLTFVEGDNHLDGGMALAFARERHSFSDGDVQRNKNQQKILAAIIKKAASSQTLLTKYSSILNSIEDYVELNMETDDIKELVKMQLDEMPSWTINRQNLIGTGDTTTCYSTGDYMVYVMQPDEESVVNAVDNIIAVKEGNKIGKTEEEQEKKSQSKEVTN